MDISILLLTKDLPKPEQLQYMLSPPTATLFGTGDLVQITNHLQDKSGMFCEIPKVLDNNAWIYLKRYREIKYIKGLKNTYNWSV